MPKAAKIIFLLVGCIFPIFIGILHTATHFSDLLTPEIQSHLQQEFVILGTPQPLWNTWGIVSFMMGASFVVIGLLNVATLRRVRAGETLPVLTIIALILFQVCVAYVGYAFGQSFQLYGGIFGGVLALICLLLVLRPIKTVTT